MAGTPEVARARHTETIFAVSEALADAESGLPVDEALTLARSRYDLDEPTWDTIETEVTRLVAARQSTRARGGSPNTPGWPRCVACLHVLERKP
jgi:hypothetical protein